MRLGLLLGDGRADLTAVCLGGPRLALVIGNDAYPAPWDLDSCVNDARAFAGWLVTVGYEQDEVRVVTNANKVAMQSGFETLVRATEQRRHDQVVIYYSGHGSTMKDDNGDEGPGDDTDEVLVAIDNPGDAGSPDKYVIRDDEFHRVVERISANTDQVVVVFDCCFSGGAMKAVSGPGAQRKGARKRIPKPTSIAGLPPRVARRKGCERRLLPGRRVCRQTLRRRTGWPSFAGPSRRRAWSFSRLPASSKRPARPGPARV